MVGPVIDVNTEASCLNDLCGEWKIVARRTFGVTWGWCLSVNDVLALRKGANLEPRQSVHAAPIVNRTDMPHYSVCTGRCPRTAELRVYARIYPIGLRGARERAEASVP